MISRLETMVLIEWTFLSAIERQIASGLDIIVHLGRLRDKSRKVLEVTEVLGYWDGRIHLQTIYRYEEIRKEDENVTENEKKDQKIKSMENGKSCGTFHREKHGGRILHLKNAQKRRDEDGRNDQHYSLALLSQISGPLFLILPGIWLYREFLEEESKKKEQEFQKQFRR